MADFSIGDAVGSGFGLIARRPVSVIVWGWVYLIISLLPLLVIGASMIPDFLEVMRTAAAQPAANSNEMPSPAIFHVLSKVFLLMPLLMISTLLAKAVEVGAIYRAMLEPENKGFLSLRLGKQELWLALLLFAFTWIVGFAAIAMAIAAGIFGALGWAVASGLPQASAIPVRALVCTVAILAWIAGVFWVLVRLALAFPLTFVEKEFRLFESWSLTKGHAWKLFFLGVILAIIMLGVSLIFHGVARAGFFSMLGGLDPDHLRSFGERMRVHPEIFLQMLAPSLGIMMVLQLFLLGPMASIFHAPWAFAYRALSKDKTPEHPPVF